MARPIERYLQAQVEKDLAKKMVFVGGPRQVGKTTLAKRLLPDPAGYLNWDVDADREAILRRQLPPGPFWVFDELHKYRGWRNFLKGLFDERGPRQKILVTGSGRLDLYRFGGDSLQGRYHYLRLNPLSAGELGLRSREDLSQLLRLGGFPEPFFGGSETEARRWSREYRARLIREDVAALERVSDLGRLELMMLRLPELVGAPLSLNALREDLQVNHETVSRWMQSLERLYAVFRVPPLGAPKIRAVKKEQKHYHFDWTLSPKDPQRFENMVAVHLKKWIDFEVDSKGLDLELRYFRDVHGREVDFVIVQDGRAVRFVECKWGDESVHPALRYARERFAKAEFWQISATGGKDYRTPEGIRVCPALTLLRGLI